MPPAFAPPPIALARPLSRSLSARPDLRACAGPKIVVDPLSPTSVTLSWPSAASAAPAAPFRITYGRRGAALASLRSTHRPFVTLTNLSPSTAYDVLVTPASTSSAASSASFTCMAADGAADGDDAPVEEAAPLTELSRLEILVGTVISAAPHDDADSLYVSQVSCGGDGPRTIVSGLVKYVGLDELVGRRVLVAANLKPRAMRGVMSEGMLLCASNDDHSVVDPLSPPAAAEVGALVTFAGHRSAPIAAGNRASKAFDRVVAELRTDEEGVAMFGDVRFQVGGEDCFSPGKVVGTVS